MMIIVIMKILFFVFTVLQWAYLSIFVYGTNIAHTAYRHWLIRGLHPPLLHFFPWGINQK